MTIVYSENPVSKIEPFAHAIMGIYEIAGFAGGRKSLHGTKAHEAAGNLAQAQFEFGKLWVGYKNGINADQLRVSADNVYRMTLRAGAAIRDNSELDYQEIKRAAKELLNASDYVRLNA